MSAIGATIWRRTARSAAGLGSALVSLATIHCRTMKAVSTSPASSGRKAVSESLFDYGDLY
ncbi:hypothetical protein [Methylobacterium indicum]|uniref:hypothetical protein n=1 Tax=Methylobacterium indicum TaxID=1775910 RepID=UPI001A9106D4|nr:hypothetical protein [Methylobacterium indicum]